MDVRANRESCSLGNPRTTLRLQLGRSRTPMRRATGFVRAGLLILSATLLVPRMGVAQAREPIAAASQPSLVWPIVGGLALGTAGWFAGALLALEIEKDCGEGLCVLDEVIFLGAATGTTGLAFGVHLGNGRRGNFLLDLSTAAAVWGTGFLIFVASGNQDLAVPLAVLVPVGQLAATTAVERGKGRAKERRRAQLVVTPLRGGRVAAGAIIRF